MAGENLLALGPALSQMFDSEMKVQWNRATQFLSMINAFGGVVPGAGKNAAWDVQFTGATAATVADGSDVAATEFNQDPIVPAILQWANYRTSFQISENEVDAAIGSEATPERIRNIFQDRIIGGVHILARQIERDLLTGTGMDGNGNPTIVGLFSALNTSGTYAGINSGTYPEWTSNILANGGVTRALTTDLLEQADANIFVASNEPSSMIITTANVARKYAGLFGPSNPNNTPLQRIWGDDKFNNGMPNTADMQQANLMFKHMPIYRNSVAPSNKLVFVNPRHMKVKYLPVAPVPQDSVYSRMMAAEGGNGSTLNQNTGLIIHVKSLAKTGDSYKFSMKATLQLLVTRPNAFAIVQDISEV